MVRMGNGKEHGTAQKPGGVQPQIVDGAWPFIAFTT